MAHKPTWLSNELFSPQDPYAIRLTCYLGMYTQVFPAGQPQCHDLCCTWAAVLGPVLHELLQLSEDLLHLGDGTCAVHQLTHLWVDDGTEYSIRRGKAKVISMYRNLCVCLHTPVYQPGVGTTELQKVCVGVHGPQLYRL